MYASSKMVNHTQSTLTCSHCNIQDVNDETNKAFHKHGIADWSSKVEGIGWNGAKVNIGRKNSVASRILKVHEEVLIVHCVTHLLELGILNAIREDSNLTNCEKCFKCSAYAMMYYDLQ